MGDNPGDLGADAGVDGGDGGATIGRPPRGRPHQGVATDQGASAVPLKWKFINNFNYTLYNFPLHVLK